jgi:hypothetical protein
MNTAITTGAERMLLAPHPEQAQVMADGGLFQFQGLAQRGDVFGPFASSWRMPSRVASESREYP